MLRRILALVLVTGPLLLACGSPTTPLDATDPTVCEDNAGPYFLFDDPTWELHEAVDYPGELNVPGGGLPTDWYAEYERLTPIPGGTRGDYLSLTGRRVAVDAYREELPGWEPQERMVRGQRALAAPLPGTMNTIVAVATADDYTVEIFSDALATEELVGVAEVMDAMCQPQWLRSGGRLPECLPTDRSCLATTTTSSPPEPDTTFSHCDDRRTARTRFLRHRCNRRGKAARQRALGRAHLS